MEKPCFFAYWNKLAQLTQARVVVTDVEELEMRELWSHGVSLYTC